MSKKDFEVLAEALAYIRPSMARTAFKTAVIAVANVCQRSNSRFDYTRFVKACEVDPR